MSLGMASERVGVGGWGEERRGDGGVVERERDYGRREKIRKRHREDELGGDGGGERT